MTRLTTSRPMAYQAGRASLRRRRSGTEGRADAGCAVIWAQSPSTNSGRGSRIWVTVRSFSSRIERAGSLMVVLHLALQAGQESGDRLAGGLFAAVDQRRDPRQAQLDDVAQPDHLQFALGQCPDQLVQVVQPIRMDDLPQQIRSNRSVCNCVHGHLPAGLAEMVAGFVAGDGEDPGGEGPTVSIARQLFEGRQEDLRREVSRDAGIANLMKQVAVDGGNPAQVELLEKRWGPARRQGQVRLILGGPGWIIRNNWTGVGHTFDSPGQEPG